MSDYQAPFTPSLPEHISFQRTFKIPLLGRVWVRVTQRHYRKRIAAFVNDGSSLNDLCVGQAMSNGTWILNDGKNLFRILTY